MAREQFLEDIVISKQDRYKMKYCKESKTFARKYMSVSSPSASSDEDDDGSTDEALLDNTFTSDSEDEDRERDQGDLSRVSYFWTLTLKRPRAGIISKRTSTIPIPRHKNSPRLVECYGWCQLRPGLPVGDESIRRFVGSDNQSEFWFYLLRV